MLLLPRFAKKLIDIFSIIGKRHNKTNSAVRSGFRTALERLNMYIEESTKRGVPSFKYFRNCNKDDLRDKLISVANKHRFDNSDYAYWGNPGYKDENENQVQLSKFKSYKLGYCLTDGDGNYIVFNFNSKTFCYFDHEYTGLDNLKSTWNISKIFNFIQKSL